MSKIEVMYKFFSTVRSLICLLALFLLSSCYFEGKLSILQGATSSDETQIHIISATNETLAFFYEDKNKKLYRVPDKNVFAVHDVLKKYSIYKVKIKGLESKHRYALNIISKEQRKLIGRRYFYTLKRETFRRVAITSCAGDFIRKEKISEMWGQLEKLSPDAVIMIGDNAYTDITSLRLPTAADANKLLQRHIDHRFTLPYYKMEELIPTYATWDDHDYGQKDGDRHFELKGKVQEIFELMYAQDISKTIDTGPGVSRMAQLGDYQVALLDNRSFRDKKEKKNGEHFGSAQRYWLQKHLKSQKPTIIVSGDQFWGEYHKYESFYGKQSKSFKSFMKLIKGEGSLSLFISGDRHMSEVQEIPNSWLGYQTYELTSSPMHSNLYPDRSADGKNSRRKWATSDQFNFMILEVFQAKSNLMSLGVSFWGGEGLIWKSPLKINKK